MEGLLFVAVLTIGAVIASFRTGSGSVTGGAGVAAVVLAGSLMYALL